jgi:quinol monooxygenase YgiN
MPATVHVLAHFRAKDGKEDALRGVLTALVAPARREVNCYQFDLLQNASDPTDFCFVERWESDRAVDLHLETEHVRKAIKDAEDLVAHPPGIDRYRIV